MQRALMVVVTVASWVGLAASAPTVVPQKRAPVLLPPPAASPTVVPQKMMPAPPPPPAAPITVFQPKPGDVLTQGTDVEIKWSAGAQTCFSIYLYKGQSVIQTIALQAQPPTPTYHWTVPTNAVGAGYHLRLITCDHSGGASSAEFPIVTAGPDMQVMSLEVRTPSPTTADRITIRVRAANSGRGLVHAGEAVIRLKITAPDGMAKEFKLFLGTFTFGDHEIVERSIRVNRKGSYSVSAALATPVYVSGWDTNAANNAKSLTFTVAGLPDLVVCCPFHYYIPVNMQSELGIEVRNYGDEPSPPYTVQVWVDGKGTQTFNHVGLAPGAHHPVPYQFSMGAGSRQYWAHVDKDNLIRERQDDVAHNKQTGVVTAANDWASHQPPDINCSGLAWQHYEILEAP
jgi:hypothetical protein